MKNVPLLSSFSFMFFIVPRETLSRTVSWLSVDKADWLLAAVITLHKIQIPN
jgi:hypothetical protein